MPIRRANPRQAVAVRLDEREICFLDGVVQQLTARNPDVPVSRSDALRHVIASSASVAAPIASTAPLVDPERPMRGSG